MQREVQNLQRTWHATAHRWNEKRRRRRSRRPFWDVLILTAANKSQARGYELELSRRREIGMIDPETEVLVVPDRAGKRIGSGGATLWALKEYARLTSGASSVENLFRSKRILLMHCGGEGRRVPSNAGTGKLFSPLPFEVVPGRAASPFDALYVFLCACGEQMDDGMVVVAGDVLAVFDPKRLHWQRRGVSGIGIPAPLDLASQHGVYVADETGRRVLDYPQKVSPEEMRERGIARDDDRALVDGAGILRFSPEVCAELAGLAGVTAARKKVKVAGGIIEARGRRSESIDLYTDIAWAMVPVVGREAYLAVESAGKRFVREALWERLSSVTFWLDVIEESVFVHLGNLWQILDAFGAASTDMAKASGDAGAIFGGRDVIASFVSPAIDLDPRTHVQNSFLDGPMGAVGADSLVAECRLGGRVHVGSRSLVRGVDSDDDLTVPDGTALFAIPLGARGRQARVVTCLHGTEDNPKKALDDGARFLGRSFEKWLERAGVAPDALWDASVAAGERTLWNARLHPVGETARIDAIAWMLDGKPAPDAWLKAERLSFEDIFPQVDYRAGFQWRENLMRRSVLANIERELIHRRDPRDYLQSLGTVEEFAELRARLHGWVARTPNPLIVARMLAFEADMLSSDSLDDALRRAPEAPAGEDGIPTNAKRRATESVEAQDRALRKVAEAVASGVSRTDALDLSCVVADQVEIRSPARIDFGGGWTDTPPQCLETGGVILSTAVLLNGGYPVGVWGEKIDAREIRLECEGMRGTEVLRKAAQLSRYQKLDDPFALLKAGLSAVGMVSDTPGGRLEERLEQWGHGLRLVTRSNVPKGSGLGTSSILGASLVACLRRLFGADLDRETIFRQVLYLEQLLTSGGGWQDQIGALEPGLKLASVPADSAFVLRPQVVPISLAPDVFDELNRRLVLFYVGKRRVAFNMLRRIVVGYLSGRPDVVHALRAIHDLAYEQREALEAGDLDRFGAQLTRVRMLYRLMCPATTSDLIEDIFAAASPYASGGKCVGAGGGGFITIIARSESDAARVRDRLKEFSWRGLGEFYDFAIDTKGLHQA